LILCFGAICRGFNERAYSGTYEYPFQNKKEIGQVGVKTQYRQETVQQRENCTMNKLQ